SPTSAAASSCPSTGAPSTSPTSRSTIRPAACRPRRSVCSWVPIACGSFDTARRAPGEVLVLRGGFAPLSTVVTRLATRCSLPPPRSGLRGRSPRSNQLHSARALYKEALQVARLGNGQEHGVVGALGERVEETEADAGVGGGVATDVLEVSDRDVMRARERG